MPQKISSIFPACGGIRVPRRQLRSYLNDKDSFFDGVNIGEMELCVKGKIVSMYGGSRLLRNFQ